MLYRLIPPTTIQWTAQPGSVADELLKRFPIEPDEFEWQLASEAYVDETIIRIALRHGLVDDRGLIVDASHLLEHYRVAQILDSHKAVVEHQRTLRSHDDDLAARILESAAQEIAAAQENVSQELEGNPESFLIAHWARLGGALPDPL
jgi:hypothetical protein